MSEETVKFLLDGAQAPDVATLLRSEVERLSKLDRAGYLVERKQIASRYKIPAAELDKLVDGARPQHEIERESLAPPVPEPWPEPVNPVELLDAIDEFLQRFLVLNKHALTAIVLWTAWTYCFEVATVSPRLRLRSPTKRCGKTRTIEVLALLIPRSLAASSISPSALFRTVDLEHCPIFLDEADTYLSANAKDDDKDLRRLLNSGHTPTSAYVIRSVPVGEGRWEPKRFSTWAPFVIAGIGKIHDTTEDRSIGIVMQRKARGRMVQSLDARRNPRAHADAAKLASRLARFAKDNAEKLAEAPVPDLSKGLNDRAAQSWDLLFSIADLADGAWPQRARDAALALAGDEEDGSSLNVRLLADIKTIFDDLMLTELSSTDLVAALIQLKDAPWGEVGRRRKPISPKALASMLKDFEIYPRELPSGKARGYLKADLTYAFESYLSAPEDDKT